MKLSLNSIYVDVTLFGLFICFFPLSVITSLYYPNVILEQGLSHRIFYFHVSVAWVALYAPLFASIFGFIYLSKKDLKWDTLGYSMNIVSLLFSICVLFSGPIWAYSAWGVPWDWTDARLQSFFVLVLSLLSYFIIRSLINDSKKRAAVSAFFSILCALTAILTWGSIRWMENPGNHPGSVLGKGGMDPDMKLTFWLNVFSYHILFIVTFLILYRNEKIKNLLQYLKETEN
jgi:heme exporter protein C